MTPTQLAAKVRYLIRRDIPEILAIEQASFDAAWTEEDFCRCLSRAAITGLTAEFDDRVVGYLFYRDEPETRHILNVAVARDVRRRGIGRQLVAELRGLVGVHWPASVIVRERNLGAQLFFRALEFKAVGYTRGHYFDTGEDAITMVANSARR